jgi:hypothetical protein
MRRPGIYLREADTYVGPFGSRADAQRFLILMGLFGDRLEGIEIVELDKRDGARRARDAPDRGVKAARTSRHRGL